ncbi:MAG: TOBE domain-containing protein [Helicobacteraceae bacterium]|jgi:molybdate transport system regulatory protein|nr:TOBE domain-containing protein [Helicobacteraceae bacterium]
MNQLFGVVKNVRFEGAIAIAEMRAAKMNFAALLVEEAQSCPYLKAGENVQILFKETEVAIAKNLSGMISLRNRNFGIVKNVEFSELLCEIIIDANGSEICSIITAESAKKMDIKIGDQVEWLVKTNEISLRAI